MNFLVYLSMLFIHNCYSQPNVKFMQINNILDECKQKMKEFYPDCLSCTNDILPYIQYTFKKMEFNIELTKIIPNDINKNIRTKISHSADRFTNTGITLLDDYQMNFVVYMFHLIITNLRKSYVLMTPGFYCEYTVKEETKKQECINAMETSNLELNNLIVTLHHMFFKTSGRLSSLEYLNNYYDYIDKELRIKEVSCPMGTTINATCSNLININSYKKTINDALKPWNDDPILESNSINAIAFCKRDIQKYFSECKNCDPDNLKAYVNYLLDTLNSDTSLSDILPYIEKNLRRDVMNNIDDASKNAWMTKINNGQLKKFIFYLFYIITKVYWTSIILPKDYCKDQISENECLADMNNTELKELGYKQTEIVLYFIFFKKVNRLETTNYVQKYIEYVKSKIVINGQNSFLGTTLVLFCSKIQTPTDW